MTDEHELGKWEIATVVAYLKGLFLHFIINDQLVKVNKGKYVQCK
jgi:hypothetical protein